MRRIITIGAWVLITLCIMLVYFYAHYQPHTKITWGVNFSELHAKELGFDWQAMYTAILKELKPQKMRVMAYWNILEPEQGVFHFEDIDWMLAQAAKHKTPIILVLGRKQPRWPECHEPEWYKDLLLPEIQQEAMHNMLAAAINHFKNQSIIEAWQIENEPLFNFGLPCHTTPKLLEQEVKLVQGLDSRPVLVTDSGELGRWLPTAKVGADWFGSTMYRTVHNPKIGYTTYPLPPLFFKIKSGILNVFARPQKLIGVELQAEPWFDNGLENAPIARHYELMNTAIFQKNIEYARAVGFEENYLWGAEWWYWLKEKQGDASMWNVAKQLFIN